MSARELLDRFLWPEERDPWVRFLMADCWYSGFIGGLFFDAALVAAVVLLCG